MQLPESTSQPHFGQPLLIRRIWSAWLAGERVELEKVLRERAELRSSPARLAELVYAELWLRKQIYESADEQEYVRRFPEIAEALAGLSALAPECDKYLEQLRASDFRPTSGTKAPSGSIRRIDSPAVETPLSSESVGNASSENNSDATANSGDNSASPRSFNAQLPTRYGKHDDSTVSPSDITMALHESMAPYGFEPICLLGVGGMGVVIKAVQRSLNREVAVKSLKTGAWIAKTNRDRLLKEAHVVAKLKHPHVVQIYDVIEELGKLFLVMEYVQGRSLSQEIDAKPIEPRRAAAYIRDIASAIAAAHAAGFMHRDIKPTNVLLSSADEIKVTDFGLARATEQSTLSVSGELLGTPAYMAPEQIKGDREKVDVRADVYGIGATLYELLTGRPPFVGSSTAETLQQVLHADPLPPRRIVDTLPQDIESICLQCLEKSPSKRYASVAELLEDIERFLSGQPTLARPVTKVEKARRWIQRNPVPFLSTLGLAASIIALMVATTWYFTRVSYLESVGLSRDEALRQARSRESLNSYYSLVSEIQTRISDRNQGWTWKNQDGVRRAEKLLPNAIERTRLRELLIQSLGGFDLKKNAVIDNGIDPYGLAWSPDNRHLVIGENVTRTLENGEEAYVLYVLGEWPERKLREVLLPAIEPEKIANGLVEGVRALLFLGNRHLVVGCRSGWIQIIDIETGQLTSKWKAHDDWCYCLAYDRQRNCIVSGSQDSSIAVWDAATHALISRFNADQFVKFIEVVGDELVCLGKKHAVFSFDDITAPELLFRSSPHASNIHIMPNGNTLLVAANNKVMLANSRLEELADFALDRTPFTRSVYINHVDLSADGNWIATCGVETSIFLNARNQRQVMAMPMPGAGANYVTFDRCGDTLWVTNNYQLLRYDLHLPEFWRATSDATPRSYSAENSGRMIEISPQYREQEFHIQVDQSLPEKRIYRGRIVLANIPKNSTAIEQIHLAHDNASANFPSSELERIKHGVVIWDASKSKFQETGMDLDQEKLHIATTTALSFDGQQYWMGDIVKKVGRLQVFRVSDGEALHSSFNTNTENKSLVGSFEDFSCGPTRTVAISSDHGLSVYDTKRIELLHKFDLGYETTPKVAALSDDERYAFVGAQEGHVLAIELETGKIERVIEDVSEVTALSTSPEGILAVGFHSGEIEFWSIYPHSPERLARLPRMTNSIQCLEFSRDGSQLAALVQGERASKLLDWKAFRKRLGEFGLNWQSSPTLSNDSSAR